MPNTVCFCGRDVDDAELSNDGMIVACNGCGTIRTKVVSEDYASMYETDSSYHGEEARTNAVHGLIGSSDAAGMSSYQRFAHDLKIAKKRWNRYFAVHGEKILGSDADYVLLENDFALLDFGCGNGAFMDFARRFGVRRVDGVDRNDKLNRWVMAATGCRVEKEISNLNCKYSVVTMHDVIEHLVDPPKVLKEMRDVMRDDGVLIVDTPDAGAWKAMGYDGRWHHLKPKEHLWFFDQMSLTNLLDGAGFNTIFFDRPIPGKLVGYFRSK